MKLERFAACGRYLDFDPGSHSWAEASVVDDTVPVNGVGDLLGGSCVALVRYGNGLEVYVGAARFDVQDARFSMSYQEVAGTQTLFRVEDSHGSADITYPSWWVHSRTQHLAFGSSPDEDEDVCAYIIYMLNSASIRAKMVDAFVSRRGAPGSDTVLAAATSAARPGRAPAQATLGRGPVDARVTYYKSIPLSRDKPSVVYKFYDDRERTPERYSPRDGWVPDKNLYCRLMSGAIDAADIVSEREAMHVLRDLDGEY